MSDVSWLWEWTRPQLKSLQDMGVIAGGQMFDVRARSEFREEARVVATDMHHRPLIPQPASPPAGARVHFYTYYVAECESRCDSGD